MKSTCRYTLASKYADSIIIIAQGRNVGGFELSSTSRKHKTQQKNTGKFISIDPAYLIFTGLIFTMPEASYRCGHNYG